MTHRLQQIIDPLKDGEQFSLYDSPAGGLLLVGDNDALNAIFFYKDKAPLWNRRERTLAANRSLRAAEKYLDVFFTKGEKKECLLYRHGSVIREMERNIPVRAASLDTDDYPLILDLNGYTLREIKIYRALCAVGFGDVISYRALAEKAGITNGARFAGNVMAKNAFPVIIPCHRVIRSDGRLGGYRAGIEIKKKLLAYEKAEG